MARQRTTPPAPAAPTAERIDAAVRKGDLITATDLARKLVQLDPKPHNQDLLRETLIKLAEQHITVNMPGDARIVLSEAEKTSPILPAIRTRLGILYARAGAFGRASELSDPTQQSIVSGHFADWVVRTGQRQELPETWHAAFDAIISAFQAYHQGKDEGAREALTAVGLTSPFLEWKVLLRGLIAWSSGDDSRAIENLTRLSPDRIPYRIAAPIRSRIDPSFPTNLASGTLAQYRSLVTGGLTEKLNKVQHELAGKKKLTAAFKAAESVLPRLRVLAPAVVPRLANVFYFSVIKQGEQDDLPRYQALFGQPDDDPSFYKLEARVFEEVGAPERSLQRWSAYEGWLVGLPNGWPKPVADRARALILQIMGDLAADLEADANNPDLMHDFPGFFGAPSRKPTSKKKSIDPAIYWKRATELAPEWEKPARDLFERAVELNQVAEAEAIARKHFAHNPKSVQVAKALSGLVLKQGRTLDCLELRSKLLALNPLERQNRREMAEAVLAHARRLGVEGKSVDALATLDQNRELVRAELAMSDHALRATLHRKLKETTQADEHTAAGLALPGSRLMMRLDLQANAVLLKLKPADKSAAGKAFTGALAEQPNPGEVLKLLLAWDTYHDEGLTYVGQKTQEKKLFDTIVRAADGTGSEVEFEGLPLILMKRGQFSLIKKFVPKLMKRYPKNPIFPYSLGEAEFQKGPAYRAIESLRKAKALAESSPEGRYKQLLPRIEELLNQLNPFGDLFGRFFGRTDSY